MKIAIYSMSATYPVLRSSKYFDKVVHNRDLAKLKGLKVPAEKELGIYCFDSVSPPDELIANLRYSRRVIVLDIYNLSIF